MEMGMENYRAARKTVSTADILGPLYLVTGFWRARWRLLEQLIRVEARAA